MIQNPNQPLFLVNRPNIGDRALFNKLVDEIFERRWFTNYGEVVQAFEAKISNYLKVKHVIAVCNATVGLQVACQAMELSGEVILPAYTFVATPHSLQWEKIRPIFVDIDPETHLMDPNLVEKAITPKTTAILGVHTWGRACYPKQLEAIATKYGIKLYFDAAHAFGSAHQGKMIGGFGACEVFSFHATKFFNTFEGGAITTNDDALAARIRLMINFGFSGFDRVVHLGTNGKMSEIHAAMGLACFEKIDDFIESNKANYNYYLKKLRGVKGVRLFHFDGVEQSNYQYIVLEINEQETGLSRDAIMNILHEKGIIARRYFFPGCHRMEPYCSQYPEQTSRLPATDLICSRVLVLPTGASLNCHSIEAICNVLINVLEKKS